MPSEHKIYYEGALAGIFSGITLKAALGTDKSSIPVAIYNSFCQATQNVQPTFNCGYIIIALAIIVASFTLLTFMEALTRTENKKHSALTYAVSYFIGLMIIMLLV
jgi:hypothetical protein